MKATRETLGHDLTSLGVRSGDLLMLHASVKSVGPIVGGVNALVQAFVDTVGPDGTLAAYVDFEPFFEETDDPSGIPVFDKRIAHAARDHGILHETLRTWPGAVRSDHPDAGVVAIGRLADWITFEHPFQFGYGEGTPFARIVEANGRVLMIGAPLETITLIHHAEHKAKIPGKRVIRYSRLMPGGNGPEWIDFEEYDTSDVVSQALPADYFGQIAQDFLELGGGLSGTIGRAPSLLFESPALIEFAVGWLEEHSARVT